MNPIVAEADSSCDPHSIRAVVEACGCDEGEAVDLLAVRDMLDTVENPID